MILKSPRKTALDGDAAVKDALRRLDQPGGEICPFEIAAHPVEIAGGSRQHGTIRYSRPVGGAMMAGLACDAV